MSSVLVGVCFFISARRIMTAICSGCFPVVLRVAVFGAACMVCGGGTAGVLDLVASCSWCLAYNCWLRFFVCMCLWVLVYVSARRRVMMSPFLPFYP